MPGAGGQGRRAGGGNLEEDGPGDTSLSLTTSPFGKPKGPRKRVAALAICDDADAADPALAPNGG